MRFGDPADVREFGLLKSKESDGANKVAVDETAEDEGICGFGGVGQSVGERLQGPVSFDLVGGTEDRGVFLEGS